MNSPLDFAALFVDSQAGTVLYFLLAVGLSFGAWLLAFDQSLRSPQEREARRYLLGLSGVVLAWGGLVAGNLYALFEADGRALLPPLERGAVLIAVLSISWAFLSAESPRPERASRFIAILLVLMSVAAALLTASLGQTPAEGFNAGTSALAWTLAPLIVSAGAVCLLLARYAFAADIPLKLLYWFIIVTGQGSHLYILLTGEPTGDFSSVVRLSTLASLALVPVILYRVVLQRFRETLNREVASAVQVAALASAPTQVVRQAPYSAANREAIFVLKTLGVMLEGENRAEIPLQVTKAVAGALKADLVALLATQDAHWADPLAAYHALRETALPALAIHLDNQPTLASAIELNIQCVLLPTRSSAELSDLFERLDVRDVGPSGPAYFQPLTRERRVVGVLVVALPYTARFLSDEERTLLESLAPVAARLLLLSRDAAPSSLPTSLPEGPDPRYQELQAKLEAASRQVQDLRAEVSGLTEKLAHEREKLSELAKTPKDVSITQQIRLITGERQRMAEERAALVSALGDLRAILAGATADSGTEVYRQMVNTLSKEKESLQAEKARLEAALQEMAGIRQDDHHLREVLASAEAEKARLAQDHARLKAEIAAIQTKLEELGLESGSLSLPTLVGHLTEERNRFLAEAKRLRVERDRLLAERQSLQDNLSLRQGRTEQIRTLQQDLSRLAQDREALIRQRDTLLAERDLLNSQLEDWLETRIKLTTAYEQLAQEVERLRGKMGGAPAIVEGSLSAPKAPPEELKALTRRLHEVEEDRSNMEFTLIRAREDISLLEREIERLETALQNAQKRQKEGENLPDAQVLVGLAQELRTPLTSIMGYTDLLLSESTGILGETQRQFLLRVQVNVEQLFQLIENLIRVVALDYGQLILAPRRVDVEDLIDDAVTTSSAQYREKGLRLSLEIAPNLPPILGDRDALQQIISRLLVNAYLASPPEGQVRVVARHIPDFDFGKTDGRQSAIHVAITDNGGGVPAHEQARVFNRHYRAENPLIQGLGDKGAGLSIAKALVLAHGGIIWLETVPNESSTFQFVIPVDHAFGDKDLKRGSVSRLIEALEKTGNPALP
jgi:signal transduction histidine kinase